MHEFLINQNSLHFSSGKTGWRKARESMIYKKNHAAPVRSIVVFPRSFVIMNDENLEWKNFFTILFLFPLCKYKK